MPQGTIATLPKFQFSANGVPMVGGTLETYIAGTTTLATTWQDSALSIANTNPITLDARGECVLWLDSAVVYKFVLKNSAGVIQWTQDNLSGAASAATLATDVSKAELAASTGASLVGYLSSFAGSVATTVKTFLDRIVSLNNGNPAHSDGANTITGSPRWFIGNNAPSADDSALLIGRGLTGSYNTGAHAVRDESTYSPSGGGLYGYASYDAIPTFSGATTWNHTHAFQARIQYAGSGVNDQIAGFTNQTTHSGTGVVTNNYSFKASDALGAGPITNNVGLWIEPLTRGTNNFAIYSPSLTLASYHGGNWQVGGNVRGNALDSINTPVNYNATGGVGIYGYQGNPYGVIRAYSDNVGTGKDLVLQDNGGFVLINALAAIGSERFQVNGSINFKPDAAATPAGVGQLVFELTSNISLKIKVKGSDSVVRSVTLTLA